MQKKCANLSIIKFYTTIPIITNITRVELTALLPAEANRTTHLKIVSFKRKVSQPLLHVPHQVNLKHHQKKDHSKNKKILFNERY